MRYLTKVALIISSLIVFFGAAAVTSADAQRRIYRRPVIIRHYDPFWRGTLWDPYWGWDRGLYRDPYYWQQREEYYDRKAVSDSQKKLSKDRVKFGEDGYIDPKEAQKLAKDREKYDKAVRELNKDD
jgi:hypothetical protein